MEREDFRTMPEAERYALRKRAIALLRSGKKQYEVATIIGTKKETICQWNRLYKANGLAGLKSKKECLR